MIGLGLLHVVGIADVAVTRTVRRVLKQRIESDDNESVALVVPCHNEVDDIATCLDSLLASDYPVLEILVVDAMSDDGTRETVHAYAQSDNRIRLIDNPTRNNLSAMNRALSETDASRVMLANPRAQYDRDYISTLVRDIDEQHADLAAGALEPDRPVQTIPLAISEVLGHWFGLGNALHRRQSSGAEVKAVAEVAPGLFRREVFDRIGLFNERLTRMQAREFAARLKQAGGKILLDPAVRFTAKPEPSALRYLTWIYLGAFHLFNARRFTLTKLTKTRNLIPLAFVAYQLVLLMTWWLTPVGLAVVATLPLVLYGCLNMAMSFGIAIDRRAPALMPLCSLLFLLTHYSYAAGTVAGIISGGIGGKEWAEPTAKTIVSPS
jgi:succinoglycan biosynthesis protein ExoA